MGQYFRPYNKSTKQSTLIEFPENGGLTWIPKIFYWDDSELDEINQTVAQITGWSKEDIVWVGDYGQLTFIGHKGEEGDLSDSDPMMIAAWPEDG